MQKTTAYVCVTLSVFLSLLAAAWARGAELYAFAGDQRLPQGDETAEEIELTASFPFYGAMENIVYVRWGCCLIMMGQG